MCIYLVHAYYNIVSRIDRDVASSQLRIRSYCTMYAARPGPAISVAVYM